MKCYECGDSGKLSVVYIHYCDTFKALCLDCEDTYWNEVALEQAIALDVEEVLGLDHVEVSPKYLRLEHLTSVQTLL